MTNEKQDILDDIRRVIIKARKDKGLSIRQLAALADCEPDLIHGYEKGGRDIRVSNLIKIVAALELTIVIK